MSNIGIFTSARMNDQVYVCLIPIFCTNSLVRTCAPLAACSFNRFGLDLGIMVMG